SGSRCRPTAASHRRASAVFQTAVALSSHPNRRADTGRAVRTHRTPADPRGLHNDRGVFASLYASHGADADRFQRRVIQFASIIFSHAGRESLQTLRVKKKMYILIT